MTPKLKIQNETDHDGRVVSGIVRWVFRELDLSGERTVVKVRSRNLWGAYAGRCYPRAHASGGYLWNDTVGEWKEVAPKIPANYDHLLVCRIAKSYPRENHVYDRKDSPGTWVVADWREALVCITAHEAMHLRQYLTKPKKRGRFNEVETEWAAYRLWKRWRDR